MSSYKIKDLGVVITGYTPKTSEHLNYSSNDYMFISPTDLKKSRYIKSTTKYISSYAFNNSKNRILKFGDIVVDCIGSDMGNVGFVYDDCISNQQINAITSIDNNKVLNLYLYYLLSTKKNYFHQIGMNGSTMPIVSKSLFEDIDISIHELDEQQHIVNTISSASISLLLFLLIVYFLQISLIILEITF